MNADLALWFQRVEGGTEPQEDRLMAEQDKTYVCEICGQEVKVEKSGIGKLVCCNRPMVKKEGD